MTTPAGVVTWFCGCGVMVRGRRMRTIGASRRSRPRHVPCCGDGGDWRGSDGAIPRHGLGAESELVGQCCEVPVLACISFARWSPQGGRLGAHVVQISVDRYLDGDVGGDPVRPRLRRHGAGELAQPSLDTLLDLGGEVRDTGVLAGVSGREAGDGSRGPSGRGRHT